MKKLLLFVLLAFNGNANAALQCYNDQGQDVTWTVGESVPYLDTEPGVYVDCAANGNELLFIQQTSPESVPRDLVLSNGPGKMLRSFTRISQFNLRVLVPQVALPREVRKVKRPREH